MRFSTEAALRYYEGDVSGSDPVFGDPKAYNTINALLYPGLRNERARSSEGKKLNPALLSAPEVLEEIYARLFEALFEYAGTKPREVFRVERYEDYLEQVRAGETLSFTSTSTSGFLREYEDKKGLALMRFVLPAGLPCIDLAEVLSSYKKKEEAEITLSPFLRLAVRELPMTEEMKKIRDADGHEPRVYCEARVGVDLHDHQTDLCGHQPAAERVQTEEGRNAGVRVYTALNESLPVDAEDERLFTAWKKQFREELLRKWMEIQRGRSGRCIL